MERETHLNKRCMSVLRNHSLLANNILPQLLELNRKLFIPSMAEKMMSLKQFLQWEKNWVVKWDRKRSSEKMRKWHCSL